MKIILFISSLLILSNHCRSQNTLDHQGDSTLSTFLCYNYDSTSISKENMDILKTFIDYNTKKYTDFSIGIHATPTSEKFNNIKLLKYRIKLIKDILVKMGIPRKRIDGATFNYDPNFYPKWDCKEVGLILYFLPK